MSPAFIHTCRINKSMLYFFIAKKIMKVRIIIKLEAPGFKFDFYIL